MTTGKTANHRLTALLLIMSFTFGGTTIAGAGAKDEEACYEVKAKIREIQDKMRAGYTNKQGERMKASLRRLEEKRRRVCR